MKKNQNIITLTSGILILLLLIVIGFLIYTKQNTPQANISLPPVSNTPTKVTPAIPGRSYKYPTDGDAFYQLTIPGTLTQKEDFWDKDNRLSYTTFISTSNPAGNIQILDFIGTLAPNLDTMVNYLKLAKKDVKSYKSVKLCPAGDENCILEGEVPFLESFTYKNIKYRFVVFNQSYLDDITNHVVILDNGGYHEEFLPIVESIIYR